jgi:hypothetical protein
MKDNNTENIGWLAGFIDGEGCFTVQVYKSCRYKAIEFKPFFILTQNNRDFKWLDKCKVILDSNGIKYEVYNKKGNVTAISIRNIKEIKKLITLLIPHMVVKNNIAKIFMDFPSGYKTKPLLDRDRKTGRILGYSSRKILWDRVKEQCDFIDKIRELNDSKGKSNVIWSGETLLKYYKDNYDLHEIGLEKEEESGEKSGLTTGITGF